MIKITFLGTSDAIPSAKRNHPAVLINYQGENILVDCGEGTQRQIRKAKLNPCKITRILITHWHGDHTLGLPGLLSTLSLSGYAKTLCIYGPKGIKKHFTEMFRAFPFVKNFEIKIEEVSGKFFETSDFYLEAKPVTHGVPCNAYSFVKKGKLRIDRNKLKKAKLPSSPILQKLKDGRDIVYQGKKYLAKNLTYREDDKKISVVLDTAMNKLIAPFAKNSNLLVCEATFDSSLEGEAREKGHLTAKQAGMIAKQSKSKKLILMHISSRYIKNKNLILDEAKKIFGATQLVKDLEILEI